MEKKTLETLAKGDIVLAKKLGYCANVWCLTGIPKRELLQITRTTKTMVVTEEGRYDKSTGLQHDLDNTYFNIKIPTEQDLKDIERDNYLMEIVSRLQNVAESIHEYPQDKLERLQNFLDEFNKN